MEPTENPSNREASRSQESRGDQRGDRESERRIGAEDRSAAGHAPGEQRPSRGVDKTGGRGGRTDRAPDGTSKTKTKRALDEELDEELEETFPASDPPSLTEKPR
jgi:hypothetical protein